MLFIIHRHIHVDVDQYGVDQWWSILCRIYIKYCFSRHGYYCFSNLAMYFSQ